MFRIQLNDGTTHNVYHCGAGDGYLSIELMHGESVLEVAEEFSDPGKTSHIVFCYTEDMQSVHDDYIILDTVSYNRINNSYRVTLRKE